MAMCYSLILLKIAVASFNPNQFRKSENPVLRRLAEELISSQEDNNIIQASHSSHSSGSGTGHSSYVSSTMRVHEEESDK
jgi:hypothetical protein